MEPFRPGENPRIIDAVVEPYDLHALDNDELELVASEIRGEIIATTSKTGGHVASSLGAVEIIVALHAELQCPRDRIVYDVGHQAYAHKILTGRLKRFSTLRQEGGISGFPNPAESSYDAHPSGHASDSLSVALGLAKARDLRGSDEHIIAVIGDASISGGMAFEALNQIGQEQARLVIVLNDNGMSISPNVGGLAQHFGSLRTSDAYRERREFLQNSLEKAGPTAHATLAAMNSAKGSIKHLLLPEKTMVFEQLGITCLPPVDGHDIGALRRVLRKALDSHGPTLVHAITRKGAGFAPAELTPELFHGVGPFDAATGEIVPCIPERQTFTEVFGITLAREAKADDSVVAITAAMEDGTGLASIARSHPDHVKDVGISEEHAVGLAAGFAIGGAKPVVAIYSTFLQRAIDQIIVDCALPKLNVTFCIDRAGLVGEDGSTHQGIFDIVYTRMIPNLRVLAPSCGHDLACALHTALALGGPFAIRYPKGVCPDDSIPDDPQILEPGMSQVRREGDDVAILAFGSMVEPSLDAAEELAKEGIEARVVDMLWVKPLDREAIRAAATTRLVVSVEEGVRSGGVGEGIIGALADEGLHTDTMILSLPDNFVAHGRRTMLLKEFGLDGAGIAQSIRQHLAQPE